MALEFPETQGKYKVLEKIGEGTFSSVYRAQSLLRPHDPPVALKRIYRTSGPSRISNEIGYLKLFAGSGNVITLIEGLRHEDQVTLVLEYFKHDKFHDYLPEMDINDIKEYMRALMSCLAYIHEHKVIHRDIKPSNFLHSRENRTYMLIDFGLAELENSRKYEDPSACEEKKNGKRKRRDTVEPRSPKRMRSGASKNAEEKGPVEELVRSEFALGRSRMGTLKKKLNHDPRPMPHAPRAGTRGFRAPEVLLKCRDQTTAIDVWSAGVTLLSMLTGRYPFFHSPDDLTALAEISALMGSDDLRAVALSKNKRVWVHAATPPVDWKVTCSKLQTNKQLQVPADAYDLLAQCLALDPEKRTTAAAALNHAFLAEPKKKV